MGSEQTPERGATDLSEYLSLKAKGMLFAGWYTDRILVEEAKDYRDRVRIDPGEVEIVKRLRHVLRRVKKEKKLCGLESKFKRDEVSDVLNENPLFPSRVRRSIVHPGKLGLG
jgi:hypothetical protein